MIVGLYIEKEQSVLLIIKNIIDVLHLVLLSRKDLKIKRALSKSIMVEPKKHRGIEFVLF